MEQITVIGNIGRDAEIKSHNGNQFVTFSIASNKKYKNAQGETVEQTNWYNCITRQVNLSQWLKRGTQVLVQGEPRNKVFKRNDGTWSVDNGVNCDKIQLLGSPNGNGSNGNQAGASQQQSPQQTEGQGSWVKNNQSGQAEQEVKPEDDLPF